LLGPRPTEVGAGSVSPNKPNDPADLGTGLRVLIRQRNGAGLPRRVPVPSAISRGESGVVALSLFLADLLLLGVISLWSMSRPTDAGAWATACTVLVIVFAAWLGILAAWLHFQRD
jgi:hypothetical protein